MVSPTFRKSPLLENTIFMLAASLTLIVLGPILTSDPCCWWSAWSHGFVGPERCFFALQRSVTEARKGPGMCLSRQYRRKTTMREKTAESVRVRAAEDTITGLSVRWSCSRS